MIQMPLRGPRRVHLKHVNESRRKNRGGAKQRCVWGEGGGGLGGGGWGAVVKQQEEEQPGCQSDTATRSLFTRSGRDRWKTCTDYGVFGWWWGV